MRFITNGLFFFEASASDLVIVGNAGFNLLDRVGKQHEYNTCPMTTVYIRYRCITKF